MSFSTPRQNGTYGKLRYKPQVSEACYCSPIGIYAALVCPNISNGVPKSHLPKCIPQASNKMNKLALTIDLADKVVWAPYTRSRQKSGIFVDMLWTKQPLRGSSSFPGSRTRHKMYLSLGSDLYSYCRNPPSSTDGVRLLRLSVNPTEGISFVFDLLSGLTLTYN